MESISYSEEKKLLPTFYSLKKIMFILLSITIGSCYSIESDCDFFWERTSGPNNVYLVAVASKGDIWAVTYSDGVSSLTTVYLSTDNGDTWVKKNNGLTGTAIYYMAISPINGYLFVNGSSGLFRSTDRGENWIYVNVGITSVSDILITPSGEIYLATYKTVFYSNDNGDTWIEKNDGLSSNEEISSFALGRDGTLYAGTIRGGVYRSTNNGDTWLAPSNYTNAFVVALTVSDDGSVFAATNDYTGFLKSTDRGVTWNQFQIHAGLDVEHVYSIIYNPITKDIFVSDCLKNTENWMIHRSTDLGESWEVKNNGLPNKTGISSFAFNPNTGQMYIATNHGVYRSRNYP